MRLKLHHQILIAMLVGAAVGLPLNILAEAGRISEAWPRTIAKYGETCKEAIANPEARAQYWLQKE